MKSKFESLSSRLNDSILLTDDIEKKIVSVIEDIEKLNSKSVKNSQILETVKIGLNDVVKYIDTLKTSHNLAISQAKQKAENDLNLAKNEILSQPSKIPEIQSFIQDKLDELRVETDGYLKDLLKVKRSQFVNEKKFENIYTLIERLKEGE